MVKDKSSSRSERTREKVNPEDRASVSSPITSTIEITVNSIENVIRKESLNVTIRVEHNDSTLGESAIVRIDANYKDSPVSRDIDYAVRFPIIVNHRKSLEAAVSVPVLIKVTESSIAENEEPLSTSRLNMKKKGKGKLTAKSEVPSTSKIMGLCNLDIMPLLLGEKCAKERLVLEEPRIVYDGSAVSWPNLPVLTVTAKREEDFAFFSPDSRPNFLIVTVESIYNPPSYFTDDLQYRAGTVLYDDNEIPEDVTFIGGRWTNVRNFEEVKCWQTLQNLESRAKFSNYTLSSDTKGIKNPLKKEIDLESGPAIELESLESSALNHPVLQRELTETVPKIEWNSMIRGILSHEESQIMQERINRYKFWPFQFLMRTKGTEGTKAKSRDTFKSQLYQSYVDVSALLFPGETRARVVAQLYEYNASDMAEKTGFPGGSFDTEFAKELTSEKEKKTRASTRAGSVQPPEVANRLVRNENGDPTFVLVEFELYRPFKAARSLPDLTRLLDQMIPSPVESPSPYPYTCELAEKQYFNCIDTLVDTILESYRDFIRLSSAENEERQKDEFAGNLREKNFLSLALPIPCKKTNDSNRECPYAYAPDELACFTEYLYRTGVYAAIRNTLKNKITLLLDQKFKVELHTLDTKESQNFVATAYIYCVERMHVALNKRIEGRFGTEYPANATSAELSYLAEEAYELGYVEDARRHYRTTIENEKNNPEAWLKYAVFLIRVAEVDRAIECCREAIVLDKRHKLALILYGTLLAGEERFSEAEIFLEAVVRLYPNFAEGWTILHLFYLRTENFPGADVTIRTAEECATNGDRESSSNDVLGRDPLAWPLFRHRGNNKTYIETAVLLLKMNCYNFAGLALAREMSDAGESPALLYYVAVQNYLLRRYDEALCRLERVECRHGTDYAVGSLTGHCHFEVGNFEEAIYRYEFTNALFDRPDDLHLLQTRMGYQYLDGERWDDARKVFLVVCKNSPTSKTWLGAGIALYRMNRTREAELALTEANRLDSRDSEIWAYLCLLNLSLRRYDEFSQCYRQAIKTNLKNEKLWLSITRSMKDSGYPMPVLSTKNSVEELAETGESKNRIDAKRYPAGGETPETQR